MEKESELRGSNMASQGCDGSGEEEPRNEPRVQADETKDVMKFVGPSSSLSDNIGRMI